MTVLIDPWGSSLISNYEKFITELGLTPFSPSQLPNPNRLMRRRVSFAGQDIKPIAECIKKGKPYYALTGIVPSSDKIHLGNKMVIENMKYFQDHGAETYVLVADLESAAARGVTIEKAKQRALKFHIPAYIALGLHPTKTKWYFQSENIKVIKMAYEAAKKFTHNEFRSAYGIPDPGKIMSSLTQTGDMLFPQEDKRMPGIIPVGVDQAVHIRICRDYIRKSQKGYIKISALYNKFTPALNGRLKMSKSHPESCIEIPEEEASYTKKIKRAVTGGRETLAEQKKKGAIIEKDMVFELLKQHLIEDDKKLNNIYIDYKSGKMTSAEIKQIAIKEMNKFMKTFNTKFKKAQKTKIKLI
jgi:tryptophanyl-tRNA synthetase